MPHYADDHPEAPAPDGFDPNKLIAMRLGSHGQSMRDLLRQYPTDEYDNLVQVAFVTINTDSNPAADWLDLCVQTPAIVCATAGSPDYWFLKYDGTRCARPAYSAFADSDIDAAVAAINDEPPTP